MNTIKSLSEPPTQQIQKAQNPYEKVAEGMERQFANHLINQMQKTIDSSTDSPASKMYKSMMNDERAKMMASSDTGLGIKKMVLEQIYPKQEIINKYQQLHPQKGENQ